MILRCSYVGQSYQTSIKNEVTLEGHSTSSIKPRRVLLTRSKSKDDKSLPDVLLEGRPEPCDEVVGVHDDVDEGVDETEEGPVTSGQESNPHPEVDGHDGVVVDVQQRDLVELLSSHEAELKWLNQSPS